MLGPMAGRGPGAGAGSAVRGALGVRVPGSEPWGSLLFLDHPHLEPRHFVDEKAVNENHEDYMFLECILFITEVSGETPAASRLKRTRAVFWTEELELLSDGGRAGPSKGLLRRKPSPASLKGSATSDCPGSLPPPQWSGLSTGADGVRLGP